MHRAFLAIFLSTAVFAGEPTLPPLREQARIQQEWLRLRLDRNLPVLMRKHGAQMWIVACREYAEDPRSFRWFHRPCLPRAGPPFMSSMIVARTSPWNGWRSAAIQTAGLYTVYRDPDSGNREIYGETQWQLLRKLVDQRRPSTSPSIFPPSMLFPMV